jgi:alkanesulfonate monooxygenase SsuD/methylene tetrahydromethanopterin reductase-like flavin-dependent oxidoreductase (luciferase family)
MTQLYKSEYAAHAADSGRMNAHVTDPRVGFMIMVHVAATDARAREQAKPAFELYSHNFTHRYLQKGDPERYTNRRHFEDELSQQKIVVGSPATVRDQLGSMVERSGANYVVGCFSFGSLTEEQTLESVDLFAKQVMPALSGARAASV